MEPGKSLLRGLLSGLCALTLASCGGASNEEAADTMRALNGMTSQATVINEARRQIATMTTKADELRLWHLGILRQSDGGMSALASSCGSMSDSTGSCTYTCNNSTASSLDLSGSCTLTSQSFSCSGTTYTVSNGSFTFSVQVANSTMSLSMNMNANVSGGKLNGKVECNFAMSFNTSSTPTQDAISCNNISCKYDGKDIDCDKLKSNYQSCS